MNIFLGWSGNRSLLAAEAFRQSLRAVFGGLEPYLSDSMNKGVRWDAALNQALDEADFGILCLTKDNYSAPWLAYEAGVLSRTAGVDRVAPFLLDTDIPKFHNPITEFRQCVVFEREDLRKLFSTVREINAEKKGGRLRKLFTRLTPNSKREIEAKVFETSFNTAYGDDDVGLQSLLNKALVQRKADGAEDIARKTLAGVERLLAFSEENQTLLKEIVSGLR